ncbi:MAG: FAD-dependent oxidoreductase [Candidatus Competibacteraceae bacterium]
MNTISRRHFLKLMGATTALAATPPILKAQAVPPRVVVVGGGFAGATVAKYLHRWGGAGVSITLVEINPTHVSCILSNLVLNGSLGLSTITFGYNTLQQNGINVIQDQAVGIDNGNRKLQLPGGKILNYDLIVLAPGIDFDPIPGLDFNKIPHAWKAGPQTTLLQQQLAAMPAGGTFVQTIPPKPYRCPPGPYERVCVVANYLKRNKPRSKVIVLDANPIDPNFPQNPYSAIVAEQATFTKAFSRTYANIVEYHPGVVLQQVDSQNKIAMTDHGNFKANVLNVIPPQRAGGIVESAGLTHGGRWALVDPLSYESTLPGQSGIHIIGDAQGTGQPKSGHIANAEAKVCADAILRLFAGEKPDPNPMTNSACFSPITAKTASWLTAVFAYDPNTLDPTTGKMGVMKVVPESSGEAPSATRENYQRMFTWANNLFADTFA